MASAEELVEGQRVIKEPGEIAAIKASLALTEKTLAEVWERLAPGRTEKEVAWEIERIIREAGAESVSFPPSRRAVPMRPCLMPCRRSAKLRRAIR